MCFIFAWLGRFEPSHATVRWTVAHRRLDGDGSIVFRISSSPPKTKRTRKGVLHFCLAGEIRTIPCNGPVDRCPSPAGRRWLHSVSNLFKSTKNEGAVRKVCRCEPVTDVTGVAAPRLNGNRLVLLPRCLKIRGIVPEGNTLGVPHQRARWFAMTLFFLGTLLF